VTRLLVSADAEGDLDNILEFGIERFGPQVGREYVVGLVDFFDRLLDRPELGQEHPGYRRTKLRGVSYRSHKVFYDVTPDQVRIVRVLHQAMDFDKHLD
jgi:toxin ParE1/3/4